MPLLKEAPESLEALGCVWTLEHQSLELSEIVRHAEKRAQLFDVRRHLAEHSDMFAVGIEKHLLVYTAVVHQRRGHVPMRSYHPVVSALVVTAHHQSSDRLRVLWIEFAEVPTPRATKQ